MTQRAEELTSEFQQASADFRQTVESLSDDTWKAITAEEGWPVGVAAHHAAASVQSLAGLIRAAASGQQLPSVTMDQLDAGNAQHAKDFANVSRAEVLQVIDKNTPEAAAMLRSLTDEQLNREVASPFGNGTVTPAQIAENILIGHIKGHLASIKAVK